MACSYYGLGLVVLDGEAGFDHSLLAERSVLDSLTSSTSKLAIALVLNMVLLTYLLQYIIPDNQLLSTAAQWSFLQQYCIRSTTSMAS